MKNTQVNLGDKGKMQADQINLNNQNK